MRVISGTLRSRVLKTLDGNNTRPTLDKVKGSVFNHLGNLSNKSFLDLYAGSGSIGIEAVSRGCKVVYFNEINQKAIKVIKENLDTFRITNYHLSSSDALRYLQSFKETVDVIYLDPPFDSDYQIVLDEIYNKNILASYGEIVVESEKDLNFLVPDTYKTKEVLYGRIKITYIRKV